VIEIKTPISDEVIEDLNVGDMIYISGDIFCGRDAVLPRLVKLIQEGKTSGLGINLCGGVIFHTAVSPAGIGPTSSNKIEIESSMGPLSKAGIKLHLGKGEIGKKTIGELSIYHAVYAIIPPVTALLSDKTIEKELVAFPELGMEALYRLKVDKFPAIIGAAKGESVYR